MHSKNCRLGAFGVFRLTSGISVRVQNACVLHTRAEIIFCYHIMFLSSEHSAVRARNVRLGPLGTSENPRVGRKVYDVNVAAAPHGRIIIIK